MTRAPAPRADGVDAARRAGLRAAAGLVILALGPAAASTAAPIASSGAPPPPEVADTLSDARLQGQGRMRFLGLPVYDIRLWVPTDFDARQPERGPLALEIEYAREFVGGKIAERSLAEMQRIGDFSREQGERWLAAMTQAFPDVKKGDRITGLHESRAAARFAVNGRWTSEVRDAEFARLFFGIWLSPRTSEPGLRAALLGDAARS